MGYQIKYYVGYESNSYMGLSHIRWNLNLNDTCVINLKIYVNNFIVMDFVASTKL